MDAVHRLSGRRIGMQEHFEPSGSLDEDTFWEWRFCPNAWCPLDTLYVQRSEYFREVWRVTEDTEIEGWRVAATAPVCAYCGGNLLTAANLKEGVDGVNIVIHP
jgi:hypothetical protein